ncbi:ABC transporter permease [Cryptosporangium aurantiacum]|uniref:Spermidine/putrescine transport system permease protein n=1 Tax=Cryptosporangium aurantiacum TaxID=134849 RepID=A0A1M7M9I8_9ACTN|nr:ABC transporter permease [Cryptosporangium aurantiacum]SHM87419.1 spermidine/putrescine transport system permease protein [Cryptosporangium aurantiacum]
MRRWLWPTLALPGIIWLVALFLVPLYVVLAIAFGTVDPIFRTPIPEWNPAYWNGEQFVYVFDNLALYGPAILRTFGYTLLASALCLVIAYPVAYFTARLAGRWRGVLLALLIAPFWISYMMRMLAWVNLLQNDGLVNRALGTQVTWLSGNGYVVVLGLVYGYVPYAILPLYVGLDRLPAHAIEAARDLGAGRVQTFWRVTLPLSRPALLAGGLLTTLPMLGDYFTNDLLSASPQTSMVGNLINNAVLAPGQTGQAAAFVLLVLLVSIVPMLLYVRSTRDTEGTRS